MWQERRKGFGGMKAPAGETDGSAPHKEGGELPRPPAAANPVRNGSLPPAERSSVPCSSSLSTWEQMAEHYSTPLNRT